jgi:hypothetical protein
VLITAKTQNNKKMILLYKEQNRYIKMPAQFTTTIYQTDGSPPPGKKKPMSSSERQKKWLSNPENVTKHRLKQAKQYQLRKARKIAAELLKV